MRLLVIHNLNSGYGEGSIFDFMRSFATDGDEVCLRATDTTTPVKQLLTDAKTFDAVVVSGGDGTVANVCYLLANSHIPVLPFPAGTANLLALNLASPTEPHALAKLVRANKTLDFDMGEITIGGKKFGFSIMAGAGYDAKIMRAAQRGKRLLGPAAYLQAAVLNAMPGQSKFTLTLDNEVKHTEGLGVLLVNFSKIQFDIALTHENTPRSGELNVVVLKAKTAFDLLPAVFAGILDSVGNFPSRTEALEIFKCKQVTIDAEPAMEVQYDGEATSLTTPFSVRVLPQAARLFVSDAGFEQFANNNA